MADYYPLLSRAVAGLETNTAEMRAAIYERARSALLAQLRSVEPPLAEADIARERLALEDVVRRIEDEASAPVEPELPTPISLDVPAPPAPQPAVEAAPERPRILPRSGVQRQRRRPLWLVAAVLVPVILAMGYFAYALNQRDRQKLAGAAAPPVAADAQDPAKKDSAKLGERLGGPAAPATPAENLVPAPGTPIPTRSTAVTAPPAVPVAQRALLLLEDPANPQNVLVKNGSSVWRLDTAASGAGQLLETVIKVAFDYPESKLRGEMTFRRNTDAALPASHTIEIVFRPEADSPTGTIKAIGLIEARESDQIRGVTLGGSPFPVADNLFLIGLTNVEPLRSRNVMLMRERDWFYLEVQFANSKRGALLLERGNIGKKVFGEALDLWQQ